MKISPARVAAFDVLLRIERDRAFSSVLLPKFEEGLSAADRGLCHELVLGTLRRQIYLDRLIAELSDNKALDLEVRIAVRLGLYQLMFLNRIPAHSAVNESIELIKRARKTSAKAFANAVLRRAARELPQPSYSDDVDRLRIETSHPRWLVERWIDQFGKDDAEQLLKANNERPGFAFRQVGRKKADVPGARPSNFVEGCFLVDRVPGDPSVFAKQNGIYFQDEGSQLVAAAISVPAGGRYFDVCAAPGGKTGTVVTRRQPAFTIAGDLHWQRMMVLRDNCIYQRALDVNLIQYDATRTLPLADESFDVVFVDAPCTGTGTIRHNPEIRYFLAKSDLKELPAKQLAILENASKTVAPGGLLIYTTCSLEPEENESVCERFLTANERFQIVRPAVPPRFITANGFGRTYPHRDQMDGFFLAVMRRSGGG
jgi:16S rRNA (cytosine967-C5)-methyltransferase